MMNYIAGEYVPPTWVVRDAYAGNCDLVEDAHAEFERWLAGVIETVKQEQREADARVAVDEILKFRNSDFVAIDTANRTASSILAAGDEVID